MADADAVISGRNFLVYSVAHNVLNSLPSSAIDYNEAGGWGSPNSMPSAWVNRGYTIGGLEFSANLERGEIRVDQEFDPITRPVTARDITLGTAFAEITPSNFQLASGMGTVASVAASSGTDEVQTNTASGTVSGGTYTLSVGGQETANIAYDASAAEVEAALELLSTVDAGDITVGGGDLPGTPNTFTFGGQYADQDVDLIVCDDTNLTGSTPAYTMTETTPGVNGRGTDTLTIGSEITDSYYSWGFDIKKPDNEALRIVVYKGLATGSPNLAFSADDAATIELEVTALVDTATTPSRVAIVQDMTASA